MPICNKIEVWCGKKGCVLVVWFPWMCQDKATSSWNVHMIKDKHYNITLFRVQWHSMFHDAIVTLRVFVESWNVAKSIKQSPLLKLESIMKVHHLMLDLESYCGMEGLWFSNCFFSVAFETLLSLCSKERLAWESFYNSKGRMMISLNCQFCLTQRMFVHPEIARRLLALLLFFVPYGGPHACSFVSFSVATKSPQLKMSGHFYEATETISELKDYSVKNMIALFPKGWSYFSLDLHWLRKLYVTKISNKSTSISIFSFISKP